MRRAPGNHDVVPARVVGYNRIVIKVSRVERMLVDAWNEFVLCSEVRTECCMGAALSTLVHAAELGHRTRNLIHVAVLSGRALHYPVSSQTTATLRRFITSRNLHDPDPILSSVLDVMKRIAEVRPIMPGVNELELALRTSLHLAEEAERGQGAVTG